VEVVRLALKREHSGIVLLSGLPTAGPEQEEALRVVNLIATQATTALALIGAREQSHRGSMKDPASSAYTFAYFVDVAGREIDMARRHGRRFALATVGIQYQIPRFDAEQAEPSVVAAERVLAAVRDTDVLARVDANEFYLLLPETGGLGAHACRRRVVSQLEAQNSTTAPGTALSVVVGVATFPHDGSDLSHLLRVAKFRADASQNSVVLHMGLSTMALADIADVLLAHVGGGRPPGVDSLDLPHYIELPAVDLVAVALGAVSEAMRGGHTRVYTTHHAGISIGGAVRAELVRDGEGVRFDTVDVSGHPGCANLEVLTIVAEHATYALIGRNEGNLVRAVHAADPLLVDLLVRRLAETAGVRFAD
jgi:GGDEF domain-containing protein